MEKQVREARGIFKRGARHLIEVYVEDEDDMNAIKKLIDIKQFKSGAEFGRIAFREYLQNHGHVEGEF